MFSMKDGKWMMNKYWREYSEIGAILWTDRSEEEDVNAGMRLFKSFAARANVCRRGNRLGANTSLNRVWKCLTWANRARTPIGWRKYFRSPRFAGQRERAAATLSQILSSTALAKRTQYPSCNRIIYPIILKLLHVYETRSYTNMKNLLIYPYNNPSRNYVRYKN